MGTIRHISNQELKLINGLSKDALIDELIFYKSNYRDLSLKINSVRKYINKKIHNSMLSEISGTHCSDRLFTETVIEMQLIQEMLKISKEDICE